MNPPPSDPSDSPGFKATIIVEGMQGHIQDAAAVLKAGLETPGLSFDSKNWQPPAAEHIASLLPQFEVTGLLGRGGMGAVYHGRQAELKRDVAIKILPLEVSADEAFAARFRREAQALARLQHPNIVGVHDFGQTSEGHLYFVMEYVGGADLYKIIHQPPTVPVEDGSKPPPGGLTYRQALEIVAQICDALQYAHDEGIIHRDIKPANILLDLKGRVKVADFGLARPLEHTPDTSMATRSSVIMGTMGYMSPEALQGHPVDHRTDIYALGALFYEMLTGQVPAGAFEPPSHRVQLDVRLDEVVLRALQQEPEKRYQQARDMRTAVDTVRLPAAPAAVSAEKSMPRRAGWRWAAVAAAAIIAITAAWHCRDFEKPTIKTAAPSKGEAAAAPTAADFEASRKLLVEAAVHARESRKEQAASLIEQATSVAGSDPDLLSQIALAWHDIGWMEHAAPAVARFLETADAAHPQFERLTTLKISLASTLGEYGARLTAAEKALATKDDVAERRELEAAQKLVADGTEAAEKLQANPLVVKEMMDAALEELDRLNPEAAPVKLLATGETSFTRGSVSINLIENKNLRDIAPLAHLPIHHLAIHYTAVADLSPLRGMKLQSLNVASTQVKNLDPLRGMSLRSLNIKDLHDISDLSPLVEMPLERLDFSDMALNDISPLLGLPLKRLALYTTNEPLSLKREQLRQMAAIPTLEKFSPFPFNQLCADAGHCFELGDVARFKSEVASLEKDFGHSPAWQKIGDYLSPFRDLIGWHASGSTEPPPQALKIDGHAYLFVPQAMRPADAAAFAAFHGSHLATFTSRNDLTEIPAQLSEVARRIGYNGCRLASGKHVSEDRIEWETGEMSEIPATKVVHYLFKNHGWDDKLVDEGYPLVMQGGWSQLMLDEHGALLPFLMEWSPPELGIKITPPDTATAGALKCWKATGEKGQPPGSIQFQQRAYALVKSAISWDEAASLAESVGGHLATITSAEEDAFIAREFVAQLPGKGLWLGGSDAEAEGVWKWTTGELFEWKNWQPGQPNAKPNQSSLGYDPGGNGIPPGWNDYDGSQPAASLIEWPAR